MCTRGKDNYLPTLEDASNAGGEKSIDCTLILAQGNAGECIANVLLETVSEKECNNYGVYRLDDMFLNVREATPQQMMDDCAVPSLVKILGLHYRRKYETKEDLKTLRYGKLLILADHVTEKGALFKGRIINFIHFYWPSLFRLPFLQQFIPPMVRVEKKSQDSKTVLFLSLLEYKEWETATCNRDEWGIYFIKGLLSLRTKDIKEYCKMSCRKFPFVEFQYSGQEDDFYIKMAFSKQMLKEKQQWISNGMDECKRLREAGLPENCLYNKDTTVVSYKDFICKELVLYAITNNEKAIPSVVDGLTLMLRKVLFTFLRYSESYKEDNLCAERWGEKVAMDCGCCQPADVTFSAMIHLAQDYIGSNNINLLSANHDVKIRHLKSGDPAIEDFRPKLSFLARLIFHPDDDPILTYRTVDGRSVEPEWYVPIIPMVLVNGADGIGTGWATKIPKFNPRDVIRNLFRMLEGKDPEPMTPWYRNCVRMESIGDNQFITTGFVSRIDDKTIEVTELPIGMGIEDFKSILETIKYESDDSEDVNEDLLCYKELHSATSVRFVITMTENIFATAEKEGFLKFFKLKNQISMSSMYAFDENGCPKKYDSISQIFQKFFEVRLEFYGMRRSHLISRLQAEVTKLQNEERFIQEICNGEMLLIGKSKADMVGHLSERKFDSDPIEAWTKEQKVQNVETVMKDYYVRKMGYCGMEIARRQTSSIQSSYLSEDGRDFKYLLGVPLADLFEEVSNLKHQKEALLKALQEKTPSDIWRQDLEVLLAKLDEAEVGEQQ